MQTVDKENYERYYYGVKRLFNEILTGCEHSHSNLTKIYEEVIPSRENIYNVNLKSGWPAEVTDSEERVTALPVRIEFFPEGGSAGKLKRIVCAIDGALKEFMDTKVLIPPAVLSIGGITLREKGIWEDDADDVSKFEVIFLKFRSLLNDGNDKFPPLDEAGLNKISELAKRNYKELCSWKSRIQSKLHSAEQPEFVSNPDDIVWKREGCQYGSDVYVKTTFSGKLIDEEIYAKYARQSLLR